MFNSKVVLILGMVLMAVIGRADEGPEPRIQCLSGDFLIFVWETVEGVAPVTVLNIKDGTESGFMTEPTEGQSGAEYWIFQKDLQGESPFNLALVRSQDDPEKIIGHFQATTETGEVLKSTSVVCTQ